VSGFLFVYTNGKVDELNFDGVRAMLSGFGYDAMKMDLCLDGIANVRGGPNRMDWANLFDAESPDTGRREEMLRAHLRAVRPDVLVVCQDWHPLSRQPVIVARRLGITTACVLGEGFFIEESEYYWAETPISDFMLVWGNLHREVFTRRGYPPDRLRVTGPARMDLYVGFRPELSRAGLLLALNWHGDPTVPIVTFATQPFGDQGDVVRLNAGKRSTLDALARAARRLGFLLLVKVHPLEDGRDGSVDYEAYQAQNADCVRVTNLGAHQEKIDIHTAIHHSDVWCAFSSSTLLEARLMNRPAIEINFTGLPSVVELGEHGVCGYATDEAELETLLRAALEGRPVGTPEGLQWALDRWFPGRFDGLSTMRTVQALLEIAEGAWRPGSVLPPPTPARMLPSLVTPREGSPSSEGDRVAALSR